MKKAKDHIIFALDVESRDMAERYVELLKDHVGMFKIGLELFIRSGPDVIRDIQQAGAKRIFLDLKLHDIPETVYRSMKVIADLNVDFVTVHCGESKEVPAAAVEGSSGKVKCLGVTVLTHIGAADIQSAGYKEEYGLDVLKLVMKRAAAANAAGCAGVICSGREAKPLKETFGQEFITVAPGIRPTGSEIVREDQDRIVTPGQAIRNGSDYLVIGRPIRDAEDPKKAAVQIAEEIEKAL